MDTNLNKETFWNPLMERFPKAMDEFCQWVDEYKAANAWPLLFSGDQIKFHDIPFDMQVGIILWFIEMKEGDTFSREGYIEYMRARFTDYFIDREITLDNEQRNGNSMV